jgi:uncharacterized membrane protein
MSDAAFEAALAKAASRDRKQPLYVSRYTFTKLLGGRIVVIADFIFTATAVVAQPITGVALAWHMGWSLWEGWLALSILLYLVTGAFWLPVVWMQMRMRDLAAEAAASDQPLPSAYHKLFWWWFAFGFPAFGAVLAIFWLMIAKPSLAW